MREAHGRGIEALIHVNNRAEGNTPGTVRALAEMWAKQAAPGSWAQLALASPRSPRAIAVYHSVVHGKSASRLKPLDARRQRPRVVAWRVAPASSVGTTVAVDQIGKVRLEHRQKALAHRGVQPQRARVHEPGAGLPGRPEERFQVGTVVRDPRKDRRHD